MKLSRLVTASNELAATRSRLRKRAAIAGCLKEAGPAGAGLVTAYLTGNLPQGRIGLGPAIVARSLEAPTAAQSSLTIAEVDATFTRIAEVAGKGSQKTREGLLGALFSKANGAEQDFLARLTLGELRHGALEGLVTEALADALELPLGEVHRAVMLAGDPAAVAALAFSEGRAALARFRLVPLRPVQPMLAQPAEDVDDAMAQLGEAALEYKLDGARVQVHREGTDIGVFSRRLNDVTASVPEVVQAVAALPVRSAIFDGETIALREDGRPHPFQTTMRRFGRKVDDASLTEALPLSVFLFDCLFLDGGELIDAPMRARADALMGVAGELQVPRLVTDDTARAAAFLTGAFDAGHEGVMAKSLDSAYAAGSRGADWLKLKQAHTLDLVVLAAEWGSGRRKGWLSNLHLGARDPVGGGFVMLGKTFKGMTDAVLKWQTRRLLELEIARDEHTVQVRPVLVAEIAVSDIQASPHYPAGLALRFARLKRYREDKAAVDADSIDTVRALHARQLGQA